MDERFHWMTKPALIIAAPLRVVGLFFWRHLTQPAISAVQIGRRGTEVLLRKGIELVQGIQPVDHGNGPFRKVFGVREFRRPNPADPGPAEKGMSMDAADFVEFQKFASKIRHTNSCPQSRHPKLL